MVFCVSSFLVIDGKCVMGKYLETIQEDKDLGFDMGRPANWYKYLREKYKNLRHPYGNLSTGKPFPIAIRVYHWGGRNGYLNLFPGYDRQHKPRKLAEYGVIFG